MLWRLALFLTVGSTAYVALATIFWLVCFGLGHNTMEMLYGGTAVYLLAFTAAVGAAWFFPKMPSDQ